MPREAFTYLIKHDTKWNLQGKKMKWWALLYILAGVSIGLAFFTIAIRSDAFQLQYMWFFTFAVPFVMMGTAYGMIAKEWKDRMHGWWLSLPYSRAHLVMAKFIAALLQSLQAFVLMLALIALFSIYAVLMGDNITFEQFVEQMKHGVFWLLVLLAFYPFVATFSFLTFVIMHTKYKPITPLLWVVMILGLNAINWMVQRQNVGDLNDSGLFIMELTSYAWIAIVVSWIVAWGIFRLVVRCLEKEVIV